MHRISYTYKLNTNPANHRYGYQGEFAEKDRETGFNHFEARLWDSRTGRWMIPDPAGQFHSPYLGMGNSPVVSVDPDGEFAGLFALCAIMGAGINMFANADNITNWDQALGYMAVGAIAGYGSAYVGNAVTTSILQGGFVGGFLSGGAAGGVEGFFTGAGNSWVGGASFGDGLANGMLSGTIGGATGALAGGILQGTIDAINGYDFWDGEGTTIDFEVEAPAKKVTGAQKETMKKNTKLYRYPKNSLANCQDHILEKGVEDTWGISEGDLRIADITTRPPKNYGLSNPYDGVFYNFDKEAFVGGCVTPYSNGNVAYRIAPKYNLPFTHDFNAIGGHELIHVFHINYLHSLGGTFDRKLSETVAYGYTANYYWNVGSYRKSINTIHRAIDKGYNISNVPEDTYINSIKNLFKY